MKQYRVTTKFSGPIIIEAQAYEIREGALILAVFEGREGRPEEVAFFASGEWVMCEVSPSLSLAEAMKEDYLKTTYFQGKPQ